MNPTTSPNPATGLVIYAKDLRRMTAFYQRTLGLQVVEDDATYAVLQNAQLQLVVQAIPAHIAEQIHIDTPPQAREDTPLKSSHRDVAHGWDLHRSPPRATWARPDEVVAVTFTRTAAAQMRTRLFTALTGTASRGGAASAGQGAQLRVMVGAGARLSILPHRIRVLRWRRTVRRSGQPDR